jgi:hypothetical protein
MPDWKKELEEYCERFDIPIEYLARTLSDPKVVPMIRGKAFEYSAIIALKRYLPTNEWLVEKPYMNAQSDAHDIDVKVTHIATQAVVRVECKLAKNGGYRYYSAKPANRGKPAQPARSEISVKCMRSRTMGDEKIAVTAPKIGVSETALKSHRDNYLPADFDVVLTSIGNTFYCTNEAGEYEFKLSEKEEEFLELLNPGHNNHKVGAFEKLYLVRAADLAVGNSRYPVRCVRRTCHDKDNCGFIPNNPLIRFPDGSTEPNNGWYDIKKSKEFFSDFIKRRRTRAEKVTLAEQLAEEATEESNSS